MNDNHNHLGGAYLRPGQLKQEITCTIDNRNGGARIVQGKFGPVLEIPTIIEGQQFVLSMPSDKGDGRDIIAIFGPVGDDWNGRRITVWESSVLNRIRVRPTE